MVKSLVVVESPTKAKTIEKYLGKDFKVMASYGHVRDLIPKEGAVNPDDHFKMHYEAIEQNIRHMDAIAKALKPCHNLYLATDPDREGEAIAWHVKQILESRNSLKDKKFSRVVFHQITKKAVQHAIENPRDISADLVNAQQARRALDYLVGFNLSPLLWKKIRPGLSAGRVQSPALRLIVEREIEIENFKSQEYWTIHADCHAQQQPFNAHLIELQGEKIEQFSIVNERQAHETRDAIAQAANGKLTVAKVVKRERKRNPASPFITSTMQQEGARKLGFSASKTMQIAQQLYEGVNLGEEGAMGLITYMRTDSVTLASEALQEIRELIKEKYGQENLPEQTWIYKTKSKNVQEAHEAIRPTSAFRTPENLKKYLSSDQLKLYTLIWKRTIACQMIEATLHTVAVDLKAPNAIFRTNGSTIVRPGFISVYQETFDDKKKEEESGSKILPPLEEGQAVDVNKIKSEQHFTEPPPRYTEASLIKTLEEYDIGRPSTYASIIATLKNRKYVDVDSKRFIATDIGRIVNRFLTHYFTKYVDYGFTAKLEDELDDIARGEKTWIPVLEIFWSPFKNLVDLTEKTVKRSDVTQEKINEKCQKCSAQLSIRLGKRGRFIGCTAYPNCDYTRNLTETATEAQSVFEGRQCPKCQSNLIIKMGRYGKFIGCSGYPNCKYMEPLEKPKDTNVTCPKCKKGTILQRKSRRGKIFYSCARYSDCDYALWNEPVAEVCSKCGWPILSIKTTKSRGTEKVCPKKSCNFVEAYDGDKSLLN
ncbi:type I DNA topoisomerase [Coxiella endosymbiont of Ornithodoros amblus]|uniref:type I DNA topoisomerase n=1 Tax=Coxiella endosymbiont of Ornithodoros amblus TaxID=1656166 RepID=UPI00244E15EB|nr:type I DNA topoisomerase [Coxiella endosymbiont of Ornithodoros amblus]MBW5802634.1 type I DNA topoisomerase [Coxiella endosymbiont of Ornithodoros amblus]